MDEIQQLKKKWLPRYWSAGEDEDDNETEKPVEDNSVMVGQYTVL